MDGFRLVFIAAAALMISGATLSCGGGSDGSGSCCKMCSVGKACGDSCIERSLTCHKGDGCACNTTASFPGEYPNVEYVEAYRYEGPSGLNYKSGKIEGDLTPGMRSIELAAGKTAKVYWNKIYLGELSAPLEGTVISYERDLLAGSCKELSLKLVHALQSMKGSEIDVASLEDLRSMGFPELREIEGISTVAELSLKGDFIKSFGIGLEQLKQCQLHKLP